MTVPVSIFSTGVIEVTDDLFPLFTNRLYGAKALLRSPSRKIRPHPARLSPYGLHRHCRRSSQTCMRRDRAKNIS